MIPRMIPRMKCAEDMPKIFAGHKLGHRFGLKPGLRLIEQAGYKHEPITLEIFE